MSLTRIQRTFVKLAMHQKTFWGRMPHSRSRKRRLKSWNVNQIKVEIINAVTGEKTFAYANEESPSKLKKWLKLRNLRAEFSGMILQKNSTFDRLADAEFKNYPIIVKVSTYQAPYLIDHVGVRYLSGKKTACAIFLRTTDNIDFLEIINVKKELLQKNTISKNSKKEI